MMMRWIVAAVYFSLVIEPARAAYTATDLYVPVAGHGRSADGRTFSTTIWITNGGDATANVKVQFLRGQQANPSPRTFEFPLNAGQTRVFDPIGSEILGTTDEVGGLRIFSNQPLLATARAVSRLESESPAREVATTFNAIPARLAIGNGQSSIAHGVIVGNDASARYKLYVVETSGEPLTYSIALTDPNGLALAQKTFFIAPREERTLDFSSEFPNVNAAHAVARIRGVNGNGKIIFAGAQIAKESQDGNAYEMSYTTEPRVRMPMSEVLVYIAVAAAIVVAAVLYRR